MKLYYSFCATNCHIMTGTSHVCFISSDFTKVDLKVLKQEAKTGFGQPKKTTYLLDYNAKHQMEKQVC